MNQQWEVELQQDFPFMKQNNVESERNIYRRWGWSVSPDGVDYLRSLSEDY